MVYFVDDLNLPEVDKYMTQSAIALLRQQMEYGHIYDMTKLAQNPVSFLEFLNLNFGKTASSRDGTRSRAGQEHQ